MPYPVGSTMQCRRCETPYLVLATYAHRKGYCTETCRRVTARPVNAPRAVTCAVCQTTFHTRHARVLLCSSRRCRTTRDVDTKRQRRELYREIVHIDLTAAQIDAQLAAMAAKRKAERSWLRVDPWAQRGGSALHQDALVTHGVESEVGL